MLQTILIVWWILFCQYFSSSQHYQHLRHLHHCNGPCLGVRRLWITLHGWIVFPNDRQNIILVQGSTSICHSLFHAMIVILQMKLIFRFYIISCFKFEGLLWCRSLSIMVLLFIQSYISLCIHQFFCISVFSYADSYL